MEQELGAMKAKVLAIDAKINFLQKRKTFMKYELFMDSEMNENELNDLIQLHYEDPYDVVKEDEDDDDEENLEV